MKQLPHRIEHGRRAGQCRDCGHHDAYSAPDTCPRCALERMTDLGREVVTDPQGLLEHYGTELWRQPAADLTSGAVKSGRFYIYVGHGDGGSLGLPMGDLSPGGWEVATSRAAMNTAAALLQRYPQVWIVTTVGCWNAARKEGS